MKRSFHIGLILTILLGLLPILAQAAPDMPAITRYKQVRTAHIHHQHAAQDQGDEAGKTNTRLPQGKPEQTRNKQREAPATHGWHGSDRTWQGRHSMRQTQEKMDRGACKPPQRAAQP